MPVLVLAGYAVLAVVVIGVRMAIQVRSTGDTGLRASPRRGPDDAPLQWWAFVLAAIPLLLLVVAPVAELLGLEAIPGLGAPAVRVGGLVLAGLGIAAMFGAQLAMGRSWRIGVAESERTDLVTDGPFRLVRNPIFTAGLVTVGGFALAVPNLFAVAGWLGLLLGVELQVRGIEEPYLRRVHGAAYDGYTARVGRFVPRLGRSSGVRGGGGFLSGEENDHSHGPGDGHDHGHGPGDGHDHGHGHAHRQGLAPRRGAGDSGTSHGNNHGHSHGVTATGRHRGVLAGALAVSLAIFVVQVIGALTTGSLALLADAGHVLADSGGVALALGASLLAARPAAGLHTFGWARAEILAAALNGLVLTGIGVYVLIESVRRLIEPTAVEPGGMAVFAAIGLVGNVVGMALLFRARDASLNMRGAFLEVATDTAASVGVLVAAAVIAVTGFVRADALVSAAIGLVIVPRALRLLREATNVLLEAAPAGIDLESIRQHIRAVDHVHDVHDLHVHAVTSGLPVLTAHVVVDPGCFHDGHAPQLLDALQSCLAGHFDVEHSTFQLEPTGHTDHEHHTHA